MTDKLSLYNGALEHLGERKLASLSENREPRRKLDTVWDGGAVRYCLSRGLWNCALRTQRIEYDPDFAPDFGYRRAFPKPADWVRTAAVCTDEYFRCPLTQYTDEAGYWFADQETLYVQFVSDAADYGGDLSRWTEALTLWAESYLAVRVGKGITGSTTDVEALKRTSKQLLTEARSLDAMDEPAKFLPPGGWSQARMGGRSGDRLGSRLIG